MMTKHAPAVYVITNGKATAAGLIAAALLLMPFSLQAADVHHRLSVTLHPDRHLLEGTDHISLSPPAAGSQTFFLDDSARVMAVSAGGTALPHDFQNGRLRVTVTAGADFRSGLTIRYQARFDDPAPVNPVNTDNPGYGVTGTIGPRGVLLLSGAGWYPRPLFEASESAHVSVNAPDGWVAVTAGRRSGIRHENGRTITEWDIPTMPRDLSLSVGPYVIDERSLGEVTVATYLFAGTRHLSRRYLDAAIGHIRRFEALLGPYPFDKFAVVENFFPTGYGFPSYTLMGTRVLQLPFIVHTSLPHEIAHCWWGNGVLVDAGSGNWSEGLTTYVADYLLRETAGSIDARDYRRQLLRNYGVLIDEKTDFPLKRFIGRRDLATKVIGYDKSAMVFHMLRQAVGDEFFWQALRTLYRERQFQRTGWPDIQEVFERFHGAPLDWFFSQWVSGTGAPLLHLSQVAVRRADGGYRITGTLVQAPPFFRVTPEVRVSAAGRTWSQPLPISGKTADFEFTVDRPPERLAVDPDVHLFRRLHPAEIPPSINTLKASRSTRVVLATGTEAWSPDVARLLVRSLALRHARIIREAQLEEVNAAPHDLLIIGRPATPGLLPTAPGPGVAVTPNGISADGAVYDGRGDAFFMVVRDPKTADRQVAAFIPADPAGAQRVARKITHYGKYSLLVFRSGTNRVKATWPVAESPLTHQFDPHPSSTRNPS